MLKIDLHIDFITHQLSTKLELDLGHTIGLYGKSGIGKSTLLKIIAGLEHPSSGSITWNEKTWSSTNSKIFLPAQSREIGMVFQDFALFPNLTVLDNLHFAQKVPTNKLDEIIETFRIGDILNEKVNEISGGQKQRVAIGRALAFDPQILLLDEPFAALDDELKYSIKHFLKTYIEENKKAALIASHDRADLEYFTDQIINLQED